MNKFTKQDILADIGLVLRRANEKSKKKQAACANLQVAESDDSE